MVDLRFAVDVNRLEEEVWVEKIDAQATQLFFFGWFDAAVWFVYEENCVNFLQKRECNLLIDTLYTILGAMKTTFEPFLSLFLFLMTFGLLIFENCSRKECLLIRYTVIKPEVINLLEEIS